MYLRKSLLILGLFLILSGCATKKFYFNESLPEEQQCFLEIPHQLTVTDFNGTKVKWRYSFWTFSFSPKALVKIPAGQNTLKVNYFSTGLQGNIAVTYTANNINVEYDFQPGVKYKLSPRIFMNHVVVVVEEVKDKKNKTTTTASASKKQ